MLYVYQAENADRNIRELIETQNQAIMAQFVKMAEKLEKVTINCNTEFFLVFLLSLLIIAYS